VSRRSESYQPGNVRRNRLAADNRCTCCAHKLDDGSIGKFRTCVECRKRANRDMAIEERKEDRASFRAEVLRRYNAGETTTAIAASLNRSLYCVRGAVRRAQEDRNIASEDDTNDGIPRCPRCHLRLPHDACLAPVYAVAQQRRGDYANG
jgi:hypothetical protein